tara:strand:- start:340 stop:537 length:198 start_codon:yes stop_codon:yes gene_type:complete
MKKIQVGIYYYEDDDGNKVYDFEEMADEFEQKLSELDKTAVVTCDVHIRTKYETPTDGYANMSGC